MKFLECAVGDQLSPPPFSAAILGTTTTTTTSTTTTTTTTTTTPEPEDDECDHNKQIKQHRCSETKLDVEGDEVDESFEFSSRSTSERHM